MNYRLSQQALEELVLRNIPVAIAHRVAHAPDQIIPGDYGKSVHQSKIEMDGKMFLVRAVVNNNIDPGLVITVYRTSNIAKYWREPHENNL